MVCLHLPLPSSVCCFGSVFTPSLHDSSTSHDCLLQHSTRLVDVDMAQPVSNMSCWRGLLVTILTISQLAGFSLAQVAAPSILSSVPSVTSSAPSQIHTVAVGLADHKMKPEVTIANIGDVCYYHSFPIRRRNVLYI